ncbi:MAG: hypothetical protein QOF17_1325, partial [Solirubrobacteraceae bacterium]|nr:hypothetical protein [Solirubrobacteraceae bacterium]
MAAVATRNLLAGGGQVLSGYNWTLAPGSTLPPGLALDNLTGVIHGNGVPPGIPGSGDYPFTLQVSDGSRLAQGVVTLQVQTIPITNPPTPCGLPVYSIFGQRIPLQAVPNAPYAVTVPIVGGTPPGGQPPYSWKLRAGSNLPSGLVLDPSKGVVRGTPVQSQAGQEFSFFVDVTDSQGNPPLVVGDDPFVITVCGTAAVPCPAPNTLQVSPTTNILASGVAGGPFSPASFSYQLSTSSGNIGFSLSGVPTWLTAAPTAGTVTTSATAVTFTVNANANAMPVGSHGATITFTNTTNGQGTQARTATLQVTASGGGANNSFANAATMALNQTKTANNSSASKEAGEPNHAGNSGGKSLWWNFLAVSSGPIRITTAGSDFDTLLAVYTGNAVNALTLVAANDDEDFDRGIRTSAVTFNAPAGTVYRIAVDGYNFEDGFGAESGNVRIAVLDNRPAAATSIVAAVAPNARTTRVGTAVTGFATIINAGSVTATSCSIAQPLDVPATFLYQTTNPATNTPTGSPNTPINIAAGQPQTFYFAINPTATFSRDVALVFKCANSNPAPVVAGLNTFLVTASATAIPDMLSIADTLSHDGNMVV